MKRIVVYAVGVLVMAALIVAPAVLWSISDSDTGTVKEPTTISRFEADYTLERDGDLRAVETIDVEVTTTDRHGIFRYFDRHDPHAPRARRTPLDISVRKDDAAVPWSSSEVNGARYTVLKIGDEDRTLATGTHRYVIGYTIPGVLLKAAEGGSAFSWDVIAGGWRQPMRDVNVRVHLPVNAAATVRCGVGWADAVPCTATGAGTRDLALHLDTLAAQTPVTLTTTLAMATPAEGGRLPWSMRWDQVLGTSLWGAIAVGLLGLVGALVGAWLGFKAREKAPSFSPVHAPPVGVSPAQGAYVARETIPRQAFAATLLDGAQRGMVSLERTTTEWNLALGQTPPEHADGDLAWSVTQRLAGAGPLAISKRDVEAGKRLQTEVATFKAEVKAWALREGYLSKTGFAGIGAVAVVGGLGLAVLNTVWNPFGLTLLGIIPGAFAIFGFSMALRGAGTKRTRAGRELWAQVGGFRQALAEQSPGLAGSNGPAGEGFDLAARPQDYAAYLPWAMAFGCAPEWARKYRTETGEEPPLPTYIGGFYDSGVAPGAVDLSGLVADFDTTVNSAIASYAATQAGAAGGGVGGGGGGGSW